MEQQIFTPAHVAEKLGVSITRLRSIAADYEAVFGRLPSSPMNATHRVWTEEAVKRVEQARTMVDRRQVVGLRHALEVLQSGDQPPAPQGSDSEASLALTPDQMKDLLQEAISAALQPLFAEREILLSRIEGLENTIRTLPTPVAGPSIEEIQQVVDPLTGQNRSPGKHPSFKCHPKPAGHSTGCQTSLRTFGSKS